jgi:quercetin dioxygenase-like cupin family protein
MDTRPTDATPFARPAGVGRTLDVLGTPYIVKVSSAETAGAFCCIEHTLPPGAGVPPHTHAREDEAFYVLAGTVTFEGLPGGPARLAAGATFYGPRGRQHSFRNDTSEPARMLVWFAPGSNLEAMFGELDAATRQAGGAPPMETVVAICARHDVIVAPPQ